MYKHKALEFARQAVLLRTPSEPNGRFGVFDVNGNEGKLIFIMFPIEKYDPRQKLLSDKVFSDIEAMEVKCDKNLIYLSTNYATHVFSAPQQNIKPFDLPKEEWQKYRVLLTRAVL